MEYKIDHIPRGGIRPGTKINPTTITIHSTGNPSSTALNERGWLTNPSNNRQASWHIAVDSKMAVEAIPLDEVAWHSGNRAGNNTSISIEICESGDRAKTIQNAINLTTSMLHERGWGVDKLRRHYDWSGKICPRIMSANNWDDWDNFKTIVEREVQKLKKTNDLTDIKINYKGKIFTIKGVTANGTNYVPIRTIQEFGHKVGWDNTGKMVVVD